MTRNVAVIGVGSTPARVVSPEVSYRELVFDVAQKAYADAGISFSDVQSFVCCEEDFFEGISITDEYAPDQMGAVLKSVETVTGDGLHGLAIAVMQIQTGVVDIAVVEAHSKASNILTFDHVTAYALDPLWNRPLGLHPEFIAGMEMNRFLHEAGATAQACDQVVSKNRRNALANAWAAYALEIGPEEVAYSPLLFDPMREAHAAKRADGAVILVLASEEVAKNAARPVWIRGTGFANDTPTLESRPWGEDAATRAAADIAYAEAGISDPKGQIDLFEVDDVYAHRELMTLKALGVFDDPAEATLQGLTARDGETPVNASGGAIGMGHTLDAIGLYRGAMCIEAIRAGRAKTALAQSWRGVPTTSVALAIFGADNGN